MLELNPRMKRVRKKFHSAETIEEEALCLLLISFQFQN